MAKRVRKTRKKKLATSSFCAVVRGRVQGVFFRDFTRLNARELKLVGYVRNKRDGSVEVVAEGDKANLEKLVELLKEGPPTASVQGVEVSWREATGKFNQFGVWY